MTASLSLLSGAGAAAAVRFAHYSYAFIIAVIILCLVALPGYATDSPMPIMALWRLASTAIGIAVEVLAASLVFPVTARWVRSKGREVRHALWVRPWMNCSPGWIPACTSAHGGVSLQCLAAVLPVLADFLI